MKSQFFLLSAILPAFLLFAGCKTGNLAKSAGETPEQILLSSAWQPGELRALEANRTYYYKRGTAGSWNLDEEFILFKKDFNGTYHDAIGRSYPITWRFLNTAKTALRFIIQYTDPLTVNWDRITYAGNKIVYTQYLSRSDGTNSLASGYRIPK